MNRRDKQPKNLKINQLKPLPIFNEVGKALTSILDVDEVIKTIVDTIREMVNPQQWSLLLLDEYSNQLYFKIIVGDNAESIKDERLDIGEGIAGWVAKEGKFLIIPDVSTDTRFSSKLDHISGNKTKSIVCIPLKSKNKILGVIEFINIVDDESFIHNDFALLTTITDYAAIAIENARYVNKIKNMTITDDLTGLFNSRYLNRFLEYETEICRRYLSSLSLIFIDLDGFKFINDNHGHLCGSKILKEFGDLLHKNIRRVDIACRFGGDEFVIVMPQTTKKSAYQVAMKIREIINSTEFLIDEGINVKITASFGIAAIPEDANDPAGLVQIADAAMYKVKEDQKNGVMMA